MIHGCGIFKIQISYSLYVLWFSAPNEYFLYPKLKIVANDADIIVKGCVIILKNKENKSRKERDDTMAAITKPINRQVVIDSNKTTQFVKDFNKNKITNEFVDSCKRAAKLFRKDK